jgi:sensor c-di-GMP phosphodiesterase-like protein
MSRDKNDATIVRTIIEMAHSLGFTVIAEGVETEEQATLLQLLRCEQAQGNLFGRPMPADEFSQLYAAAPGGLTIGASLPKRKGPARAKLPTPPAAARSSPGGDD